MNTNIPNLKIPLIDKSIKNSKGIPAMVFIEDIPEMCSSYTAELLVEELNAYLNKYKYMEAQTLKHSESVKFRIPDIEKAKETVEFLKEKKVENEKNKSDEAIKLDFMVAHNLWAKAEVPVSDKVGLWLGANILCEFPHDEALELLNKNLNNALQTIKSNEETIDFLRDQITITEVNIGRAYNHYVEENNKKEKK